MKFILPSFLDKSIAPLAETVELCLWTPWLQKGRIVSLLIIGNPEIGATTVMKMYKDNEGLRYTDVVTPYGIIEKFGTDLQNDRINYLILPDVGALSGSYTSGSIQKNVSFMKSLTEESVHELSIFYMRYFPEIQQGFKEGKTMHCGIITKLQTSVWEDARHYWRRSGFISRLHPFSMSYSDVSQIRIADGVTDRSRKDIRAVKLHLPSWQSRSSYHIIVPEEIRKEVVSLGMKIRDSISDKEKEKLEYGYGFREVESVSSLLQAITLKREFEDGHKGLEFTVSVEDWELCRVLSHWWNYSSKPAESLDNIEVVK